MQKREGSFLSIVIGAGFTVILSLVSIIIFAFIIKNFNISQSVIKTVNQFIKSVAIFSGCLFFLSGSKGLVKGAFIGFFSAIILWLLFGLILGGLDKFSTMLIDGIFCAVLGGISGIITVNLKK